MNQKTIIIIGLVVILVLLPTSIWIAQRVSEKQKAVPGTQTPSGDESAIGNTPSQSFTPMPVSDSLPHGELWYKTKADQIHDALKGSNWISGPDLAEVHSILMSFSNSWYELPALYNAFGLRPMSTGFLSSEQRNLIQWLQAKLTAEQFSVYANVLDDNGLNFRMAYGN